MLQCVSEVSWWTAAKISVINATVFRLVLRKPLLLSPFLRGKSRNRFSNKNYCALLIAIFIARSVKFSRFFKEGFAKTNWRNHGKIRHVPWKSKNSTKNLDNFWLSCVKFRGAKSDRKTGHPEHQETVQFVLLEPTMQKLFTESILIHHKCGFYLKDWKIKNHATVTNLRCGDVGSEELKRLHL